MNITARKLKRSEMAMCVDRLHMSKTTPKNNKKLYKRTAIAVIATPLILIAFFILFIFQAPQYSFYYVKCGFKQPVKIENNSSQRYTYVAPGESGYDDAVLFVVGYYCTEQEAKDAGHERTNG